MKYLDVTKMVLKVILLFCTAFAILPIIWTLPSLFLDNTALTGGINFSSFEGWKVVNLQEKLNSVFTDKKLLWSLLVTVLISSVVGILTASSSMALAYTLTRIHLGRLTPITMLAYSAYLTPPIILVLALDWLSPITQSYAGSIGSVMLGLSVFLFPLNYGLAFGFWRQVGFETDRSAAADGAPLWNRFKLHVQYGSPPFSFGLGLALLTFMLAWSDVTFSKILLSGGSSTRLFTDQVIEVLKANEMISPRGDLALVGLIAVGIASTAAYFYARLFISTGDRS